MVNLLNLYDKKYTIHDAKSEYILNKQVPIMFIDFLPVSYRVLDKLILEKVCDTKDSVGCSFILSLFKKISEFFDLLCTIKYNDSSRFNKIYTYFFNYSMYYKLNGINYSKKKYWEEFMSKFNQLFDEFKEIQSFIESSGK